MRIYLPEKVMHVIHRGRSKSKSITVFLYDREIRIRLFDWSFRAS